MSFERVGWLGVRTEHFAAMQSLLGDVLDLEASHVDRMSARYRLGDGTELHVYSAEDTDHEFFGDGPVVGFVVADAARLRSTLENAGVTFLTPLETAGGSTWCHFRGPDGNVYEIISREA